MCEVGKAGVRKVNDKKYTLVYFEVGTVISYLNNVQKMSKNWRTY